jgi:hypothetical protein
MADGRILAAMTRFMTVAEMTTAYGVIFAAYSQRLEDVTVITGKSSEGESAQAQVVVTREDYLEWMDCLETLLAASEAEQAGKPVPGGPVHVSHYNRWVES